MTEHNETKTGERYMTSPLTGTTYRVTKWVDTGDGKAVALEKEEIDEESDD